MFKHTVEYTPMNRNDTRRTKSECTFINNLSDICRYTVGFFLVLIILVVLGLGNIVLLHQFSGLVNGYLTLNMTTGSLFQII